MMPHAGGQYVYLREAFGPHVGIPLRLDAVSGGAGGNHCGGRHRLREVPRDLFPFRLVDELAQSRWHTFRQSPFGPHGPGQHGCRPEYAKPCCHRDRDLSLRGQHLRHAHRRARCRTSSRSPRRLRCWAWCCSDLFVGRNAQAIAANFGAEFWRNAGWHSLHPVEVGVGGPIALVGVLTILAVAQTGSLFSSDAWNNITFTAAEVKNPKRNLPLALAMGTGAVTLLVCAGERCLPDRAAAAR